MAIASHFTPVTIPALARQQRGGPLVAVAGVCGGAGVTTLALLLAYAAARASESTGIPVLCCDTGGPLGGLSVYANTTTARTLPGLADHLAHGGALTTVPFAEGPGGMRLLAGAPKFSDSGDLGFIQQILLDARAAHGLTVVDCGTLQRPADQVAFSQATHVLWVAPATVSGARRAARALDVAPPLSAREAVIARCD
jgi:Flp pilus assembly CpaE family ATPase